MSPRSYEVQVLYEISLAIGREDTLADTGRKALSAYIRKLNCTAGAILERVSDSDDPVSYDPIATVPERPTIHDTYREAVATLTDGEPDADADADSVRKSLPTVVEVSTDERVHLMDLADFGILVLVNAGEEIPEDILVALDNLNRKLGDTCRAVREKQRLRKERNRFEALFDTIPEPVANIVPEDGTPVVKDLNPAFTDTFDVDPAADRGRPLDELLSAGGDDPDHPGRWALDDPASKHEVVRETSDGPRTFSIRSAPVSVDEDADERFGLYVDVTDQREREQTLEQLYRAAEDFLDEDDERAVCRSAVEAASLILEFNVSGVHLYDRGSNELVPVATAGTEQVMETDPTYTDPESVVWEVYRSGDTAVIDDTETFDGQLPNEDTSIRSAMIQPLGDHGVFVASSEDPSAFDAADRNFGRLLATMLQTALDRVGRERALREINRTTSALVTGDDVDEVSSKLVERTSQVLGAPIVGLWEYDPTEHALLPVAASANAEKILDTTPKLAPGNSLAWQVYESGDVLWVDDVGDHPEAYDPDSPIKSELIVPIGDFGVVIAGSTRTDDFTQTEFEMLQTLSVGADSALQLVDQQKELRMIDQILARVLRHNIRNDLNVIHGRAEMIADAGSDHCVGNAEEILRICRELQSTATNARDIREVINRRGQRSQVDLTTTIETVSDSIRELYPGASVVVQTDGDHSLRVHPNFDYVLRHAIENGIEHNDLPEPRVEVGTRTTETGVEITVTDDGPGLPESEIEPLRSGEEDALSHTSGVGLWIIDRVVSYSGGTVRFESDGDGTSVRIRFNAGVLS